MKLPSQISIKRVIIIMDRGCLACTSSNNLILDGHFRRKLTLDGSSRDQVRRFGESNVFLWNQVSFRAASHPCDNTTYDYDDNNDNRTKWTKSRPHKIFRELFL